MNSARRLPTDLLIFDLDGTLSDSIPPAIEAIQDMLAELGLPHKTKEEINRYVGFGEIPLISGAIGSDEPSLIKKAIESYERLYTKDKINSVTVYPHVKETLEFFKNKKKIILSNKKDDFIKIILDNHKLGLYFTEVLGGDTAPCLKPDPCTIKNLLDKYKILPGRTLLVGDMTVDIETGKNAGVHTCAVTYGFDDRQKLEKLDPDYIIDDILELKDLIA